MRFNALSVNNFRAVKQATLNDLPNMVVIAGPNGCGKSSIFDAIRLVKSTYGGYQPNEWQHWFNEFQINLERRQPELLTLFQDRSKPLTVSLDVALSENEKIYIRDNAKDLLRPAIWNQVAPEAGYNRRNAPLAAQLRQFGSDVDEKIEAETAELLKYIESPIYRGEITIKPDLSITVHPSPVLQLIFSIFEPQKIGVVEYHGAQRTYQREQLGSVNLSIDTNEQQTSQHALYNYASKFTNIKSEMASSYIRDLIGKEVGADGSLSTSLISTLQELFETFFPGKHFLGPRATRDGRLLFPVKTDDGVEHDINDLSSGEKEVLYGYLRLHNLSPRNSVIMIDEPELHLNPRLIRGLPQFYDKHLGSSLGNQIWLLTHSDALLREALISSDFSVFHMQIPSLTLHDQNQMVRVHIDEELDRAIIDLVGDLATYRPGAKVVILEGGGDSDFDLSMMNSLFPEFQNEVNAISGGNKSRVLQLNQMLRNARERGAISATFYAIVDRDTYEPTLSETDGIYNWNCYHIENYLLEPRFILTVLQDALGPKSPFSSEGDVEKALTDCASLTLPSMVRQYLEQYSNQQLISKIKTRIDPSSNDLVSSLRSAVDSSIKRIVEVSGNLLSNEELTKRKEQLETKLQADLISGNWRVDFRGRDILKEFVNRHSLGMKYEYFRNLIISKMRDQGYRPADMQDVVKKILDA